MLSVTVTSGHLYFCLSLFLSMCTFTTHERCFRGTRPFVRKRKPGPTETYDRLRHPTTFLRTASFPSPFTDPVHVVVRLRGRVEERSVIGYSTRGNSESSRFSSNLLYFPRLVEMERGTNRNPPVEL